MNMEIIKGTKEHLDDVYALKTEVHDVYVEERPDIYQQSEILYTEGFLHKFLEGGDTVLFLGLVDGIVVSYLFYETIHVNLPMMQKRTYGYIHDFAVAKAHRRKGIGKEILRFIEAYSKQEGATKMELAVHLFSKNAIQLYESIGYETRALRMDKHL